MTMIVTSPVPRAIHALVIGVGEYPWLLHGSQPRFSSPGGMGQLTSAPESARKFARWFLDGLTHPDLPNKSLDLLVSDETTTDFDSGRGIVSIERATMGNVEAAIRRWVALGEEDEDSILIFFFCGHGLGRGNQTILLMEDFGSLPNTQSLRRSLDFSGFVLGMDQCKTRHQCYFIDACRVGNPYASNALDYFGDPVMIPGAAIHNRNRSAPVFYSAGPGTSAYGKTGVPSFFTSALLKAFEGAGSDDTTGAWRVESDNLHRGIRAHLERAVAGTSASDQVAMADGLSNPFTLHQLPNDPIVPVEVTCSPELHNRSGALSVSDGPISIHQLSSVASGGWKFELPFGSYRFDVNLPQPTQPPSSVTRRVRPPFQKIEFPIL